jgi:superfamily II DNA/RNA helicase
MEDENMLIESSEKIELIKSFDDLNLNENLLRGLYAYGFNKPSAV